jgi:hypothetical protein
VWAYRRLLGREPEGEEVISEMMRLSSPFAVIEAILDSPEYMAREEPLLNKVTREVVVWLIGSFWVGAGERGGHSRKDAFQDAICCLRSDFGGSGIHGALGAQF